MRYRSCLFRILKLFFDLNNTLNITLKPSVQFVEAKNYSTALFKDIFHLKVMIFSYLSQHSVVGTH